jgi:hypothetical protein
MVLALISGVVSVPAEMTGDDYRSQAAPPAASTRQRLEAELESARQREAEQAARRAAERKAEQARLAAVQAARPPGERLLEARCTACHTLAVVDGRRQGALGWRWTVERMRWWHQARLGPGEAGTIVAQLGRSHGAGAWRALLEWALALLLALAAAAGPLAVARRRATRHAARVAP